MVRVEWETQTARESARFSSRALTRLVLPAPEGAEIVNRQAVLNEDSGCVRLEVVWVYCNDRSTIDQYTAATK